VPAKNAETASRQGGARPAPKIKKNKKKKKKPGMTRYLVFRSKTFPQTHLASKEGKEKKRREEGRVRGIWIPHHSSTFQPQKKRPLPFCPAPAARGEEERRGRGGHTAIIYFPISPEKTY